MFEIWWEDAQFALSTPAGIMAIQILVTVMCAVGVLQLLYREYSWVDRLWSILPPVYTWVYAWCNAVAALLH